MQLKGENVFIILQVSKERLPFAENVIVKASKSTAIGQLLD